MPQPGPQVETATTIINEALLIAGITGLGITAGAEDINNSFRRLNDMLAQWQHKRWLIWHLVNQVVVSTGAQSYTVGSGQQFTLTPRPDRIESAFLRMNASSSNPVDVPLDIIPSREDYDQVRMKSLGTFTRAIWYDTAWPIGLLYPVPVPQASLYSLGVSFKAVLNAFNDLTTQIMLPPEYAPAMKWNLARRTRVAYRRPKDDELNALANDALNVLRMANAQVPLLRLPRKLNTQSGVYNPYSDSVR